MGGRGLHIAAPLRKRESMHGLLALLLAAAPDPAPPERDLPRVVLDLEAGPLYVIFNDQRFGGDGTSFDAGDVGQQRNLVLARRLSLEVYPGRRHQLFFVYAPLDIATTATLDAPITFDDVTFGRGAVVDTRYLFDGYRLTYQFGLVPGDRFSLWIGLAAQIRNAQVAMERADGTAYVEESDIGIVGAPSVRLAWVFASGAWFLLDALAFSTFGIGETTGSIYDLALSFGVPVGDPASVFLRVRTVGGGADVPSRDFENFAQFVTVALGARLDLTTLLGP